MYLPGAESQNQKFCFGIFFWQVPHPHRYVHPPQAYIPKLCQKSLQMDRVTNFDTTRYTYGIQLPVTYKKVDNDRYLSVTVTFSRRLLVQCTLCLKKRHPFYIRYNTYNLIRCHPILSILGRNILQEIWNKHKCTDNHIPFRAFVLYRVKSSYDLYGIQ